MAPIILFYVMWIVMVLTIMPAVILNGLTEIFTLRSFWLHPLIAAALAALPACCWRPTGFST